MLQFVLNWVMDAQAEWIHFWSVATQRCSHTWPRVVGKFWLFLIPLKRWIHFFLFCKCSLMTAGNFNNPRKERHCAQIIRNDRHYADRQTQGLSRSARRETKACIQGVHLSCSVCCQPHSYFGFWILRSWATVLSKQHQQIISQHLMDQRRVLNIEL